MRDLDHFDELFDNADTVGPQLIARAIYAGKYPKAAEPGADALAPIAEKLPDGESFPANRARGIVAAHLIRHALQYREPWERLSEARGFAGLGQQAIADAGDWPQSYVSQLESNARTPGKQTREKYETIADRLESGDLSISS